jgi:hypothetical protein
MSQSLATPGTQARKALVEPFQLQVPQSELDDLKSRLARTRWPDELPESGSDYGATLGFVQEMAEYWRATDNSSTSSTRAHRSRPRCRSS